MRQKQGKIRGIGGLLGYLDEQINGYYQKTGNYPQKIIMSPGSKEKLFFELKLGTDLSNSWADKKDNYKNIPIKIGKEESIILQ